MGLLRLIFAIAVVLTHSGSIFGFSLIDAPTAVEAFYIISGFYMAMILNEKYIGINNSYKLFITNRLLRLYPVYWAILLLTIGYSLFVALYSHGTHFAELGPYITYSHQISFSSFFFLVFTNIFLFLQDIVMFLGLNSNGHLFFTANFRETNPMLYQFLLIPQAWTIGVEIAFYLIAPFIVRKKAKFIIFLIILSLLLRIVLATQGLKADPWSYRFFPTELVFFLLGVLAYHIYTRLRTMALKPLYLHLIFAGILAFTVLYNFVQFPFKNFTYLFIFAFSLPFIFVLTKSWKKDRYIGELSYPVYISHILVMVCLGNIKISMPGGPGLYVTIATILFSIMLNELIAKRIERIRQRRVAPINTNDRNIPSFG